MCSDMIVPCAACLVLFFFFNDTATTEIYTLSLHDALPIWPKWRRLPCEQQLNMGQSVLRDGRAPFRRDGRWPPLPSADRKGVGFRSPNPEWRRWARSEEHTSELQSLTNLVCRLLLEKKKNITKLISPM